MSGRFTAGFTYWIYFSDLLESSSRTSSSPLIGSVRCLPIRFSCGKYRRSEQKSNLLAFWLNQATLCTAESDRGAHFALLFQLVWLGNRAISPQPFIMLAHIYSKVVAQSPSRFKLWLKKPCCETVVFTFALTFLNLWFSELQCSFYSCIYLQLM